MKAATTVITPPGIFAHATAPALSEFPNDPQQTATPSIYEVGIDGGGSYSRLIARDQNGRLYGPYYGACADLSVHPTEKVYHNLQHLLGIFLQDADSKLEQIRALCFGGSGADLPEELAAMKRLFVSLGFACPLLVVNRSEMLLESELQRNPGVVLTVEAGSMCFGKSRTGKTARCGGWGALAGDEGGGYWIGREAIRRSLLASEGRGPQTVVSDMLCRHWGLDNLLAFIRAANPPQHALSHIADLTYLVDMAACNGDIVAQQILLSSAKQLYQLIQAVKRKLTLPNDTAIVFYGGPLDRTRYLRALLLPRLQALGHDVRTSSYLAYMGALSLAQQMVANPSR